MRFLVDQNLPSILAEWISQQGHEAKHVRLLGLAEADPARVFGGYRAASVSSQSHMPNSRSNSPTGLGPWRVQRCVAPEAAASHSNRPRHITASANRAPFR